MGMPNTGKSTLFNRLTGSHAHIFHGLLIRIPIRNRTFPSAPVPADHRPLLITAMTASPYVNAAHITGAM